MGVLIVTVQKNNEKFPPVQVLPEDKSLMKVKCPSRPSWQQVGGEGMLMALFPLPFSIPVSCYCSLINK